MTQIQVRRGAASGENSWSSLDPNLAAGEIGFEIDTNRIKVGKDALWSATDYLRMGGTLTFNATNFELSAGTGYDGTIDVDVNIKAGNTIVAGSANKLETARKINGTPFDGQTAVVTGSAIYGTTVDADAGVFTNVYVTPLSAPPVAPVTGDVWIAWA